MKIWGIIILFMVIITLPFIWNHEDKMLSNTTSKTEQTPYSKNEVTQKEISASQVHTGDLLLVNDQHPVKEAAVKKDIVNLYEHHELKGNYGLYDASISLSKEVTQAFNTLISAANRDGVQDFIITSGYRNSEEQNQLYEEMGSEFALPGGFSEHQLGLSLDVGSTTTTMDKAAEGKWIEENAWKYGFILRYPKGKTDITGISYEPWHIRYVGLPHSAIMKEKDFVLEEYLTYLKEEETISTTFDGKNYQIQYYPAPIKTIDILKGYDYIISGNNVDGVIVTTFKPFS
ncbi:M15 family metallopeptidase [Bacillaceae bacterium SIJ1]|uniref:M15 family metallopeptidase n=1 Tax=Litoribacterium kuwaitense TaxID=1398745 RepID=UPI0013EDCE88|nr:M15 family metallopeptidase [Litoribacterium kuwaitense]NGP45378.1 M15 family metallopeptidase [Litoribacterium kuwaitense]